jgi:hypothetical protein
VRIAQAAFNVLIFNPFAFGADWAWGVPLIVPTVLIHVAGLGAVSQIAVHAYSRMIEHRHPTAVLVVVMGVTTLLAICLHAIEAAIWAAAFLLLGALPDSRTSLVYSLNAITSYDHTNLSLGAHWQLMGSREALNGWLLFGLTSTFLFAVIQKVWLLPATESTATRRCERNSPAPRPLLFFWALYDQVAPLQRTPLRELTGTMRFNDRRVRAGTVATVSKLKLDQLR